MECVADFPAQDGQPLADVLDERGGPREVDADGGSDCVEVVLAEQRGNYVALVLACHLVAVDQLLLGVAAADVRIVEQVGRLYLHFCLVANHLQEGTLASVKSGLPDATPPSTSRMRSAEPTTWSLPFSLTAYSQMFTVFTASI